MDVKDLYFVGTCLDDLRSMPEQVRKQAGFELHNVQIGKVPTDWKPVTSIGMGVREIRIQYRGQYRLIYVNVSRHSIYVLHAFRKKTQKTSKEDLDIAKKRYRQVTT